jgi:hypothetical protein
MPRVCAGWWDAPPRETSNAYRRRLLKIGRLTAAELTPCLFPLFPTLPLHFLFRPFVTADDPLYNILLAYPVQCSVLFQHPLLGTRSL